MIGPVRIIRGLGIAAACLVLIVGGALGADAIVRGNSSASAGLVHSLLVAAPDGSAAPGGAGAIEANHSPEPSERAEASHSPEPSEAAEAGDDNGVDADDAAPANDDHGAGVEAGDDKGGLRPSGSPEPGKTPKPSESPRASTSSGSNSGSGGSGGGSNDGSGHL